MSDHVDGPRQIGDPSADLTDLFAFISPADPNRTVLAANVFPSAGTQAMFSNAVNHAIVARRLSIAGTGDQTKFRPGDAELRFNFRFDVLERAAEGKRPVQRGTCTVPGGQTIPFVVDDEKGATSADGVYRVFAGLRSDPFYLAWIVAEMKKFPNLLQHDNVLSFLIEFDTRRVLDPAKGSLFGVIAETIPIPKPGGFIGHEPPRIDWVGRPEQTNMRLNNNGMAGTDDLRDLWNQQTPFAISQEFMPLFRKRMVDSLKNWDLRDGKADWTPKALAANANMFLDDFMVIDVAKPTTDTSHLEIEKSTLAGRPHSSGGGRTVNADVIDILLTWMVNHDREFLQGGSTGATKPGTATFPYLASPNAELQNLAFSVDLAATPDQVWALIGGFGGDWHPLIASVKLTGTGVGQLRTIETIDGKQIIERLDAVDEAQRSYRYTSIAGIPATDYTGMLDVKPKGSGSSVEWRVQYMPGGQPDLIVKTISSTLLKTGLDSLKPRFGTPP
jgi:hypothetical protein